MCCTPCLAGERDEQRQLIVGGVPDCSFVSQRSQPIDQGERVGDGPGVLENLIEPIDDQHDPGCILPLLPHPSVKSELHTFHVETVVSEDVIRHTDPEEHVLEQVELSELFAFGKGRVQMHKTYPAILYHLRLLVHSVQKRRCPTIDWANDDARRRAAIF